MDDVAKPTQMAVAKYWSERDYSVELYAIMISICVASTLAVSTRIYARFMRRIDLGWDDAFAVFAYLALMADHAAKFIVTKNELVGVRPSDEEPARSTIAAFRSVGFTYASSVIASKLSILFLLRRIFGIKIFGMDMDCFRWLWWATFLTLIPFNTIIALVFAIYPIFMDATFDQIFSGMFNLAVSVLSFFNIVTDLMLLILPIKPTLALRFSKKERAQVLGLFALGSVGTAVSLARFIRATQFAWEHWDKRYYLYNEIMLCSLEAGIVLICACLPVCRPVFVKFGGSVSSSLGARSSNRSSGGESMESPLPVDVKVSDKIDDSKSSTRSYSSSDDGEV